MKTKRKWIVIYKDGKHSIPLEKQTASSLFNSFDAKYLVKVTKIK